MSNQIIPQENQEETLNLRDLFFMLLARWRWFVASVVVALGLALAYLAITPPTYTRSASLLIKDDRRSGSLMGGAADAFADMGFMRTNSNVKNEILTIQAKQMMVEVVRRMGIDKSYMYKLRGLRPVELYGKSPVIVSLDTLVTEQTSLSFTIKIEKENQVSLSDFVLGSDEMDVRITGAMGDTLSTPCGKVKVELTPMYDPEESPTEIYFAKGKIESVAGAIGANMTIALAERDATVANITLKDLSSKRAEDIISTLIFVYNENWIKDRNQIALSTSRFIDERLRVIEQELGSVDKDISSYKSQNLLPNVQAVSQMALMQSGEHTAQSLELNNQLSMARYVKEYMNDVSNRSQLLPANSGINNPSIEQQIRSYNELALQRNSLLANSSEQNPIVSDMTQSLASMKQVILRSIDDFIATLNIQIDNTRRNERATNQKLAATPGQENYLLSVERQQKIKESLYLFLLQKREENELSQAFAPYNSRIIQTPTGSTAPTAPRKSIILMISLILGLVLPAVLFYLLETMNTTVRGRTDLTTLSLPFLGEIPLYRGHQQTGFRALVRKKLAPIEVNPLAQILIEEKNRNHINEAFRVIRTNIDFMRASTNSCAVMMLTSVHQGSGKTFTTINLAKSMAIRDFRVLAIDMDIRKGTLSKFVDTPKKGLTDYLNRKYDSLDGLIVKGEIHHNLDILPVGTIPPNPAELLLRDRLAEALTQLRGEYDYIFLDSPPIDLVTDTDIIGKHADYTLFVVRAGLMDRRMLPGIEAIYKANRFPNMCVILNGTQPQHGYGRYGYGYGYGYGNTDTGYYAND